eukprot:6486686-Amphidinium_carterae.1
MGCQEQQQTRLTVIPNQTRTASIRDSPTRDHHFRAPPSSFAARAAKVRLKCLLNSKRHAAFGPMVAQLCIYPSRAKINTARLGSKQTRKFTAVNCLKDHQGMWDLAISVVLERVQDFVWLQVGVTRLLARVAVLGGLLVKQSRAAP